MLKVVDEKDRAAHWHGKKSGCRRRQDGRNRTCHLHGLRRHRKRWAVILKKFPDKKSLASAAAGRAANIIRASIDVAFVGVGENGHLAFNDPPADFETEEPYVIVTLDEPCRRQQLNEGWFSTLDDVPRQAISMTIRQILKSNEILCIVPDARKAPAVKKCFEGQVSPMAPASALQKHRDTIVYLDAASSSMLSSDIPSH